MLWLFGQHFGRRNLAMELNIPDTSSLHTFYDFLLRLLHLFAHLGEDVLLERLELLRRDPGRRRAAARAVRRREDRLLPRQRLEAPAVSPEHEKLQHLMSVHGLVKCEEANEQTSVQ